MEPAVWTALISGGAALVVALLGIGGTWLGQRDAAKRAHKHALDLFKQQAAEQGQIRKEEAAERRLEASLSERRPTYVKLLRAVSDAREKRDRADKMTAKADEVRAKRRAGQDVANADAVFREAIEANREMAALSIR